MMIFFALMIVAGVIFGTGTVVVDLGYGMDQQTVMQTGADGGAMAGAKLLATSVDTLGSTSTNIIYRSADSAVHSAALTFAQANRDGGDTSSTYPLAVEYLVYSGGACPTTTPSITSTAPRTFTTSSDFTALGDKPTGVSVWPPATWQHTSTVPDNTCAIRVFTRTNYNSIFALVPPISLAQEAAIAVATARVYPASLPTTATNTWPITHWAGDPCVYTPGQPCPFWTSSGGTSFKQLLDFSEYSTIGASAAKGPYWNLQHLNDYDHNFPGTNPSRPKNNWGDDWDNWFLFGFHGILNVADSRCQNIDVNNQATWNLTGCTNSRVERYGGTHGSNIAADIWAFIDGCTPTSWSGPGGNPCSGDATGPVSVPAHKEGFDPAIGNYVTMHVFLWKFAEEKLDPTPGVDLGTSAVYGPNSNNDRVIFDHYQCFRFGDGTGTASNVLNNSSVEGFYVSCPSSIPSGNGPPSTIANAVKLVA